MSFLVWSLLTYHNLFPILGFPYFSGKQKHHITLFSIRECKIEIIFTVTKLRDQCLIIHEILTLVLDIGVESKNLGTVRPNTSKH